MATNSREKHIGQVFTPDYIVCSMLDYTDYKRFIRQMHSFYHA